MNRNSGFTLAEIAIATGISALVTISIFSVFAMTNRTWREASANVTLQSNGRLILNEIACGSYGRYGIREANYSGLTILDSGKSIQFSVDKNEPPTYVADDDTICRFYLQNNRIWYDPNVNIEDDEYPLVNNGRVERLTFTKYSGYINIELIMKDYASTRSNAYVKLTTNVFLRKAREILQ